MARTTGRPIRDELVIAGQELAQSRGVTEFSYADLAERVGIRTASIHHHFARKEDLVAEMASRYRQEFAGELDRLRLEPTGRARLEGYRDLFTRVAAEGRLCLCGSAAAEWSSIGDATKSEVRAFFAEQRVWLRDVIADGVAAGEFSVSIDESVEADLILAALEGATLLARADVGPRFVDHVFDSLWVGLTDGA